jgi:hypothetical protein
VAGTSPILDSYALLRAAIVPASIPVRSWSLAIRRPLGGYSELPFSSRRHARIHWQRRRRSLQRLSLVQGAEMRVAETRVVNRALRKAYGIGMSSVEEIGSFAE